MLWWWLVGYGGKRWLHGRNGHTSLGSRTFSRFSLRPSAWVASLYRVRWERCIAFLDPRIGYVLQKERKVSVRLNRQVVSMPGW